MNLSQKIYSAGLTILFLGFLSLVSFSANEVYACTPGGSDCPGYPWRCTGGCSNCYCDCAQLGQWCSSNVCETSTTNYGTCFCGGDPACNGGGGGGSSSSGGGGGGSCTPGGCSCGAGGAGSCIGNSGCPDGTACCTADDPPGCSGGGGGGGCTASCGPNCGQGDGCGGSCSSDDNYWNYGACQYGSFSRTNTNACAASQTQSCVGSITGYFFDASDYDACPAGFGGAPVMENGSISAASSTITYNATTNAGGYYSISARSPDTYALTVLPREPDVAYVSTPKFICNGSSATFTGVSDAVTRNYGFWRIYGGWFQSTGGGMYGSGGISLDMPASIALADQKLILDGSGNEGVAGLAYTRTGTIDLGTNTNASISTSELNSTGTGYTGDRTDYTYFLAKMGVYDKITWDGIGKPAYNQGGNDYVIYTRKANSTIDFSPSAGEKMIFLIDGDVTVDANIDVPVTPGSPSFLAVIASGTITFKNDVDYAEGWYVGDQLVIETLNDKNNEKQFIGEGSFVGWTNLSLQRDRGLTNNSEPSEKFVFRPDMLVNAPAPMTSSYYIWRQENP